MKTLLGKDAERVLRGLPMAKSEYIKDEKGAVKLAKKYKYPAVLKLISAKAVHKTEKKGVRIVHNEHELKSDYKQLSAMARKLKGRVLMQEFARGRELIVGIKNDPVFGQAIMFGIGGTMVEVLHDVAFRVCPITERDAQSMIDELHHKKLLGSFRGDKPVNLRALKSVLVKTSRLAVSRRIQELDINPLIANDKGAKIVDVRISVL